MASSVIKMESKRGPWDGLVCASILPSLKRHWAEEIERAVDRVKLGLYGQRTRDQTDRWIRHLWYRSEAMIAKQSKQAAAGGTERAET